MKAIRFMNVEQIELSDVPMPEIRENEVLAKISYAGFCGTDLDLLNGSMVHIKNGFTKYPLIPGHEWSGVIVEVGSHVTGFKVGDKVTSDVSLGCGECEYCRKGRYNLCPNREVIGSYRNRQGAFAEYIAVPQRHLYHIPENLSLEEAALAEPAATAAYAVKRAQIQMGDTVFVIGDGPIGQLAAQLSRINGAARVIMAGSWEEKLAIAKTCGTDETINYHKEDIVEAVKRLTGGNGPEVIIESSGNQLVLNQAVKALRPGGTIALISWYADMEVAAQMNNVIAKDCNLVGALASPNSFRQVLDYMAEGRLLVKPLITHRESLEHLPQVIRMIREEKEMRIKVLLRP